MHRNAGIVALLLVASVLGNPARESYQRTAEILEIVRRIEETLSKEDRLREISDVIRMSSTLDKMSKKLDRVASVLEGSRRTSHLMRSAESTEMAEVETGDVGGRLDDIGERLERVELSVSKMEVLLNAADLQKLQDIDHRSSQIREEQNKKLGKMMNVISALYEMNKDLKKNMGARSEQAPEAAHQDGDTPNSFASEYLVENLVMLEKKIEEQFSIFKNEMRSEITGLKIIASSISNGCDSPTDPDDLFTTSTTPWQARGVKKRTRQSGEPARERDDSDEKSPSSLVDLLESLGRSNREIKEEIQQGMQAIDLKLSNLTSQCEDPLEASASVVSGRVSREYVQPPVQSLQGVDDKKKEACSKTAKSISSPKSCADLRRGGATCDGTYIVFLQNTRAVRVFCDMTTEGGGWTVLMRRGSFEDKMTSFHRNWLSYKNGFGDVEGEFWLGNDAIHALTEKDDNLLRVRLQAFDGDDINMTYSSFRVASEDDGYRMNLGAIVGKATPAANSLKYHNNHPFSTFDVKNDPFTQNCAATYKGGWWFNGCYFGFLTGEYFRPEEKRENWQGILWYDWKGNASLKGGLMMIRPKNFTVY